MPTLRIILTIILLISVPAFDYIYESVKGPVEGKAAVLQLEDDDVMYAFSRRVITNDLVRKGYNYGVAGLLLLVWGSYIFSNRKVLFGQGDEAK